MSKVSETANGWIYSTNDLKSYYKKHAEHIYEFIEIVDMIGFADVYQIWNKVIELSVEQQEEIRNSALKDDEKEYCYYIFKNMLFEKVRYDWLTGDELIEKMKSDFDISIRREDLVAVTKYFSFNR